MAVTVGSARIDENGNITGGKAGDQTGKEVSTQDWYKHTKGWVVLRPKDPAAAAMIAACMRAACNNAKIGYDQNQRNTLYTAAKGVGFDCALVDALCETDCSALVRVCCAFAGILVGDFNTASQVATLMASGAFEKLTDAKYTDQSSYLRAGDILVTATKGHTVVVLTDGSKAEAVPAPVEPPAVTSVHGIKITGDTVNVRKGPGTQYGSVKVAKRGEVYAPVDMTGWKPILLNGAVVFVSEKYCEEV